MANVLTEKGVLTVCIGEGLISSFELGALAPGDVVRSTQAAGRPLSLKLNGFPVATCTIVPIGGLFFAWITSLETSSTPERGSRTRDELTELLPFALTGGSIRVSLEELRGVGVRTLISLGTPFSTETDVELQVLGIPAARGKLVVIGEEFGIRITQVLGKGFQEPNIRASGSVMTRSEAAGRAKDYDVTRPDRFTATTISRMAEIHRTFLKNLSLRLPEAAAGLTMKPDRFGGVDQCTYAEALAEVSKGGIRAFVAENVPWRKAWSVSGEEPVARPPSGKLFLEAEDAEVRVSAELRDFISRIFDERARWAPRNLVLVYCRPGGSLTRAMDAGENRDAFLACLRGGWKNLVNLNLQWLAPDDPVFSGHQILPDLAMVIGATVVDANGEPAAYVVYPEFTLDPLMGVLD